MITYDLNLRGGKPKYLYLYECIKDDIAAGRLAAFEKLPSKRAFANHLNVGKITIEKTYDLLLEEGYIYSMERSGYYVEEIRNVEKYMGQQKSRRQQESRQQQEPRRQQENQQQDIQKQQEPEYFMDFKANRISLTKFPVSVWSRLMRETLTLREEGLYKPVSYKGLYELRIAIAEYLRRMRGMEVDPELIIVGAGTEYLYSRLLQLLGKNNVLAMEHPGYSKIAGIAKSYGNEVTYVPIDEEGLCVDQLEESDADIVHVSPANHFPTGTVLSIGRRVELFEWAEKVHKRYIVEDDYDSEFRYNGLPVLPLFQMDAGENVIYMNTFSKTLVPTLRISYMILPRKLMERFEQTMSFYSCTVSSFEQYTLARFISEGHLEQHINRMRNYYKKIRAQVMKSLKASELSNRIRIEEHHAGTHFLLHIKTPLSREEIGERAAQQEMLLNFYADYDHQSVENGECSLIFNYASITPEQIDLVVERLCRIFTSYKIVG